MSQIGQLEINYNLPESNQVSNSFVSKVFVIGLSQRGPIYRPTSISSIDEFLIAFGQPTNKYEFDFFQSVKSIIDGGGIAICYRIPYSSENKLFNYPFEYYITNISEINQVIENLIFRDIENPEKYYRSFIAPKNNNFDMGLYIQEIPKEAKYETYYVLKIKESNDEITYYMLYIREDKMYVSKIDNPSPRDKVRAKFWLTLYYTSDGNEVEYGVKLENKDGNKVGLYLFDPTLTTRDFGSNEILLASEEENDKNSSIMDVVYKSFDDDPDKFVNLSGAKLTFTPINDFNSILIINSDTNVDLDPNCYTLKNNIDPSEIIGIFPILFGTKDADNLRNVDLLNLYPYNGHKIEKFDVYTYDSENPNYTIETDYLKSVVFNEFEYSSHFKNDWVKNEIGSLISNNVPADLSDCKNTMGIAFIALYLDDEHKLDYQVLESYYGLVGISNKRFKNLEDLVNNNSKFFNLKIDGEIKNKYFIRAFNPESLLNNNKWILPLCSPKTNYNNYGISHEIDTENIFSLEPTSKFDSRFCISLSSLYQLLNDDSSTNLIFDYIIAPGMFDVLLDDDFTKSYIFDQSVVPYYKYTIDIDRANNEEKIIDIPVIYQEKENVKSLIRLMGMFTSTKDKRTISMIDIPEIYNEYFKYYVDSWYDNDKTIKENLICLNDIFPQLSYSMDLYDRTYPLFNYQNVDKDSRLTRYKKFDKSYPYEIVPPSTIVINAYVKSDMDKTYDIIAGQQSAHFFEQCHGSIIDMKHPKLFKLLYDLYGVSSLINNKNNETFPIQQTTWNNTLSILKQLHAFRIYIEIRQQTYNIAKSYLYESNIPNMIENFNSSLTSMLYSFKQKYLIEMSSYANVWADETDIENHQVNVEVNVAIFGTIVKIILNMNLQDMTIEYV